MLISLWCLLSCRASSILRTEILLGLDGLARVRHFSVMLWQKTITSKFALKLQSLAGATLVAVQMTSPAQAKAEVSLYKQLTVFPCASTGHTVGLQDPPKDVQPPGQPAATETGNRGGGASTSASGPSLAEPTGNDHTAKWKVYTSLAKKLVAQVPLHLSRCSAC